MKVDGYLAVVVCNPFNFFHDDKFLAKTFIISLCDKLTTVGSCRPNFKSLITSKRLAFSPNQMPFLEFTSQKLYNVTLLWGLKHVNLVLVPRIVAQHDAKKHKKINIVTMSFKKLFISNHCMPRGPSLTQYF